MSTATLTKSTTQTSVTLKQSQKLVQTMLMMSFGCISYLRGLFDESCFSDQRYYPNRSNSSNKESESIRVKTLIRGTSEKVDSLLDWLDKGVLPAVAAKYLKALSLSIYLDENKPLDILEAYTFTFEYGSNDDGVKMNIVSEAGNETESSSFSLLDTRKAVEQMMRKLILLTQSFQSLPSTRNLSIRLLFNDSCPATYQPSELFKDVSGELQPTLKIDKLELNELMVSEHVETPFHKVRANILNSATHVDEKDTIQVDPFELVDPDPVWNIQSQIETLYKPRLRHLGKKEQSQVTEELETFLNEQTTISYGETQQAGELEAKREEKEGYDCECGSTKPLQSIEVRKLQCPSCHKNKHASCYAFDLSFRRVPQDFVCYSCRSKKESRPLHSELPVLMNVRKIFKMLLKLDIPETLSGFIRDLGFPGDFISPAVSKAFSVLFHDGILVFTDKPLLKRDPRQGSQFLVGSDYIDIDMEGLSFDSKPIHIGKRALLFTPLTWRTQKSRGEDYSSIVRDRKNFYFNETADVCLEDTSRLSTYHSVDSDPIVESQGNLDAFEDLVISRPPTLKRQIETEPLPKRKSRKISSATKNLNLID